MSFGFSVGDLIAGANLTYQLIKALRGVQDAGVEYRGAIEDLGSVQQAIMRVSCLGAKPSFPLATFDSASYIIMGSMDMIGSFLERTKKYDRHLGLSASSSSLGRNWRKIGWKLFKAEEMKALRANLNTQLQSLSVLLAAANFDVENISERSKYSNGHRFEYPISDTDKTPMGEADASDTDKTPMGESEAPDTPGVPKMGIPTNEASLASMAVTPEDILKALLNQPFREELVQKTATLLQLLLQMGPSFLDSTTPQDIIRLLNQARKKNPDEEPVKSKPIRFRDAVGRKFSFPFHLCATWKGMEHLIKQAFLHVDIIGPHVDEGHYDLLGPDNEIILPAVWETVVQPDWIITMHMWPMPEPKPQSSSPPQSPSPPPSSPPTPTPPSPSP